MVNPQVKMISSHISHMPLNAVWRESGVTQKHGFELLVDTCFVPRQSDGAALGFRDRAPRLLAGEYDFIGGLHHETYVYRAKGDKRFVYLAQAQNDWDDRFIARPEIRTPKDLEGKKVMVADRATCVYGNLRHALQIGGVDLDTVDFISLDSQIPDTSHRVLAAVVAGDVAAANIAIPFDLMAEKRGLHTLSIPSLPVIHNTTVCANREWVENNEDTAVAYLKSMIDAIHYFKRNKSHVCEILERNMAPIIGIEAPDEIEHLYTMWAKLLSPKPYPHPLAVWNVYVLEIAPDPNVNFIGPFEIWDTSLLRGIDDSGYIDELYDGAHMARNPDVNPVI